MSVFDRPSILVLAVASACANDEAPGPPDIAPLLAAYSAPGGKVDASAPAPWFDKAQARLDVLGAGEGGTPLVTLLKAAFAQLDRVPLPDTRAGIVPARVDGVVELDLKCGTSDEALAHVSAVVDDG